MMFYGIGAMAGSSPSRIGRLKDGPRRPAADTMLPLMNKCSNIPN